MKSREPKKVVNAETNTIVISAKCPVCLSGIDPTVATDEFADALRESL
jgi:hypothetical protein